MGINAKQLREEIIRPVLDHLDLWSLSAENLVLGTALVESRGEYLEQLGGGPALGLWQMEPATHNDIWANFLRYKSDLAAKIRELETSAEITNGARELVGNLFYAAAMCRIHYRRVKQALPAADDARDLAAYWKQFYNTVQGAGTVEKAVPFFEQAVKS